MVPPPSLYISIPKKPRTVREENIYLSSFPLGKNKPIALQIPKIV